MVAHPFLAARALPPLANESASNATAPRGFTAAPTADGGLAVAVTVPRAGRAGVDIVLYTGGLITAGDVALSGSAAGSCQPVGPVAPGANASAVPPELRGLADGALRFECRGLPAGRYAAVFTAAKGGERPGCAARACA